MVFKALGEAKIAKGECGMREAPKELTDLEFRRRRNRQKSQETTVRRDKEDQNNIFITKA